MNPKLTLLLLPFALMVTVPHAQQSRSRVGFVNVQAAVKAMPNSATYLKLNTNVTADLAARTKSIQALAVKAAASRKAADQQALVKAQQAFRTTQNGYQSRLNTAFAPLATKLNATVAKVAKTSGFTVVLDQSIAAKTGLVVYANSQTTDLTPAVIKALK
ncbi:OmpH family outer membrane protein [Deinococcus sp. QL22]|uniref:OmpH family outer membrane protein n=1 Tax=Deinococcus sp. QL22 TaxID=2939437 RepID=UPI002017D6B2|nr:OmpH family outer membrane protein [Deinococcus sp. QL22]UQN05387.1 OmpH family outer membrane protein [Deinococcus sp. QL22]